MNGAIFMRVLINLDSIFIIIKKLQAKFHLFKIFSEHISQLATSIQNFIYLQNFIFPYLLLIYHKFLAKDFSKI
jgi:hypothetical protein